MGCGWGRHMEEQCSDRRDNMVKDQKGQVQGLKNFSIARQRVQHDTSRSGR